MEVKNFKEIYKYEIYSVLHSRLKTHDRVIKLKNKNIYFLPTLYWNLFKNYERNYSNEILHHQIMNINFHFKNDNKNDKEVFQNIDSFLLDNKTKELKIVINKKKYTVLTPIKDKCEKIINYENLVLSKEAFRVATIDHNPTFKSFFEKNSEGLKNIFYLSNLINPNKSSAKKINKALNENAKKQIIENKISIEDIWNELVFLAKHQKLEIVHQKYNIKE